MTHAEQDALIEEVAAGVEWTRSALDRPEGKTEVFSAVVAEHTISLSRITVRGMTACYGVVAKGNNLRVMRTETAQRVIAGLDALDQTRPH